MKQVGKVAEQDVTGREIEVSIKIGELAILYSLLAQTSTEDVRNAITETEYVPSSLADLVGTDRKFNDFRLYKEMQEILVNNGYIKKD